MFSEITGVYESDGAFDIGALAGVFTPDEISRIVKLGVDRQKLDNSRAVFMENVRALRDERERRQSKSDDAFDAIMRLREKNKTNS